MANSDDTVITLEHPLTYQADKIDGGGEREVTEIRVPARVKAWQLRAMDQAKGEIGKLMALIAAVTGLPRKAVDDLDADDVASVMEALEGPLERFQGTGQMPLD